MVRGTITLDLKTRKDDDDFDMFQNVATWRDVPEEALGAVERDIIRAVCDVSEKWDKAMREAKQAGTYVSKK